MILFVLQFALIPMTLDSTGATVDSVTYRLAWGYDSQTPALDSVRAWWGSYPKSPRTKKLTPTTRSLTVRFPQRSGLETALRVACLRVWQRLVPVLRCVSQSTAYPIQVTIRPDSAAFLLDNGVPRRVYPP